MDNNNEKEYTPTPDEMAENNQQEATATDNTAAQTDSDPVVQLQQELGEQKEKYIRLYSEFDNFRRRTAKEKSELVKTATEDLMKALLPVLDDAQRAQKAVESSQDIEALREGLQLVFGKLFKTLESNGLKPMNANGTPFDADLHEAITQIPAPTDELKGKVIDEVEKGYYLHEKPIRFAKVIIGA
ncbi:molecular chaperone GrpE [Flexibacter flexilis DSM 6793]|uniref:Protein GrpE n=1 Tax=Flexibacter flexilis DSM 6793 TaxID=927664 RepID=A0A1I1H4Z6_9BACT|nr:nucleotide exchange factor GrpE [Flexibacter flexilis]SFC18632.1 molecular chaperone GrpE [Flexibacter flexilis DSM 6793]